jgi:hypothetical protein
MTSNATKQWRWFKEGTKLQGKRAIEGATSKDERNPFQGVVAR